MKVLLHLRPVVNLPCHSRKALDDKLRLPLKCGTKEVSMAEEKASAESPTNTLPNRIRLIARPAPWSNETVLRKPRLGDGPKKCRPLGKVSGHVKDSEINPGQKLVWDELNCVCHKLELSKLNLHVFDCIFGRMPVRRKPNHQRWAASCIPCNAHVWIRRINPLSIGPQGLVQIHEQRDSERCQLFKISAIRIDWPKL